MKASSKNGPAEPAGDISAASSHRLSLGPLGRLLSRIGETGPARRAGGPPLSWQDDEFLYIEATLPGLPADLVDVSVSGGRVFIRIGHAGESPPRPARPGPGAKSRRRGGSLATPAKRPVGVPRDE